jgi:hypothetical protein
LCIGSAYAAGQTPQSPSPQPDSQAGAAGSAGSDSNGQPGAQQKIDPAKEADIRRLLDLAGGTDAIKQVMDGMQANMKGSLVNSLPPGDYRGQLVNLFFEKFRSKADTTHLIDLAVQVYDKYLTDDDIKGLIQFYSTPLGKKTLSVLPKVTVEMQSAGMQWGQTLGKDSMREVLAEHPELLKALQEAAKNNATHQ